MALVYRVINEAGNGMYQGGFYFDCCTDDDGRADDDAHTGHIQPNPHGDKGLSGKWNQLDYEYRCNLLFGFASLDQMSRWIHKHTWRKNMHDRGGKIAVFEVEDKHMLVGDCQVVFNHEHARLVHHLNVYTLEVLP